MNVALKKIINYCILIGISAAFFACNPEKRINRNFNYIQKGLDSLTSIKYQEPTIAAGDNITIQVVAGSLVQQDASLFNLNSGSSTASVSGASNSSSSGASYNVDKDGKIEMPKIGKIKAEGLTKNELGDFIAKKLKVEELVKEPLVIVRFTQFKINVLGEVRKPGVVFFKSEKANILEAIAEAGDLTEFGKREDIIVMRQQNEKWQTFKINLKNTDFFRSPVFYLKNNDFVYVGANDIKLQQININPNTQKDIALASTVLQTLFFILQSVLIIRSFK